MSKRTLSKKCDKPVLTVRVYDRANDATRNLHQVQTRIFDEKGVPSEIRTLFEEIQRLNALLYDQTRVSQKIQQRRKQQLQEKIDKINESECYRCRSEGENFTLFLLRPRLVEPMAETVFLSPSAFTPHYSALTTNFVSPTVEEHCSPSGSSLNP